MSLIPKCNLGHIDLIESFNTFMSYIYIGNLAVLILACFALAWGLFSQYYYDEGKLENKCPRCAAEGVRVYVLPGEHCRRCNQPG